MVTEIYQEHMNNEYYLEDAMKKSKEIVSRDMHKYTRETAMHSIKQKGLPQIGGTEITRISLKDPGAFGQLLSKGSLPHVRTFGTLGANFGCSNSCICVPLLALNGRACACHRCFIGVHTRANKICVKVLTRHLCLS